MCLGTAANSALGTFTVWKRSSCEKLACNGVCFYSSAEYLGVSQVDVSENVAISGDDADGVAVAAAGRQPALTGCPWHDVNEMLQAAGLRPTRQRMALGWLLFGKGARHLTAEMLYEEATHAKVPVSLATVYNTLNQLTDAGLLRQVSVDGTKTYFDTNVVGASSLLSRRQSRAGRHSRSASGAAENARSPRRLRDQPRRHGRAPAQEALSSVVQIEPSS